MINQQQSFCPNCLNALSGEYCFSCGQRQKRYDRFVIDLLSEASEDVLRLDSRIPRTLLSLFFRPGFLVTEFIAGRRARYIPVVRLYLVTSLVLMFFISGGTSFTLEAEGDGPVEPEQATVYRENFDDFLEELRLEQLVPEHSESLKSHLRNQADKTISLLETDPALLVDRLFDLLPPVMFVLLPIFAVFLKVLYFRQHIFYTEHLLLAVYNHCFLFLSLLLQRALEAAEGTVLSLVTEPLTIVVSLWIPVYMYQSLRVVYQQGHIVTTLKALTLFVLHSTLFYSVLLVAVLWQALTL